MYKQWVPYTPPPPPVSPPVVHHEDWIGPYDCIVPGHLDSCIDEDGCNRLFRPRYPGQPARVTKKGVISSPYSTPAAWLARFTVVMEDGRRLYSPQSSGSSSSV